MFFFSIGAKLSGYISCNNIMFKRTLNLLKTENQMIFADQRMPKIHCFKHCNFFKCTRLKVLGEYEQFIEFLKL